MAYKNPEDYRAYMRTYMKKQYERDIQRVRDYKVSKGCADCGYNAHHAGLELDHREGRGENEFSISQIMGRGWKRIQEEMDKCDVVCGTCHNVRTWNRLQEKADGV